MQGTPKSSLNKGFKFLGSKREQASYGQGVNKRELTV
jgi:hypothetical protein